MTDTGWLLTVIGAVFMIGYELNLISKALSRIADAMEKRK